MPNISCELAAWLKLENRVTAKQISPVGRNNTMNPGARGQARPRIAQPIESLHDLEHADRRSRDHFVALAYERRLPRRGSPIEAPAHRCPKEECPCSGSPWFIRSRCDTRVVRGEDDELGGIVHSLMPSVIEHNALHAVWDLHLVGHAEHRQGSDLLTWAELVA